MDEQRMLLDSLMGINRNNDRKNEVISDFRDERVCKFYLVGMCPHEMFLNTKQDMGPCKGIHSEDLKMKFENSKDISIFDARIERDFLSRINAIDTTIKRARIRLEEEKALSSNNPDNNPEVLKIIAEIQRNLEDCETNGNAGNIDIAIELMTKIDTLNTEKTTLLANINEQLKVIQQKHGADTHKKLRVCDVCGSLLSILDSDKRLADHFMGKQHIGFQTMRDVIEGKI
jgi:hypothetical protein